jgi:predicted RNase H-related nuclease YkuK (DUF458 family)
MAEWFTGSGEKVKFETIVSNIKDHVRQNGMVYVGTDSFLNKDSCIFSTAIVLHGADTQVGGRYFIKRTQPQRAPYKVLITRITEETNKSVQLALRLVQICPNVKIELHLDISASDKKAGTSPFSDMLVGYARGAGFETKIKPEAFAAASIADKHSK